MYALAIGTFVEAGYIGCDQFPLALGEGRRTTQQHLVEFDQRLAGLGEQAEQIEQSRSTPQRGQIWHWLPSKLISGITIKWPSVIGTLPIRQIPSSACMQAPLRARSSRQGARSWLLG